MCTEFELVVVSVFRCVIFQMAGKAGKPYRNLGIFMEKGWKIMSFLGNFGWFFSHEAVDTMFEPYSKTIQYFFLISSIKV